MQRAASAWACCLALLVALAACQPPEAVGLSTQVEDWRDEVIYQIVVDRFANGDPHNDVVDGVGTVPGDLARHQGGDWRGVESKLGYLQRLGATTLWISPIVANVSRAELQDGYHGYWAADFTRSNARFGSLEDLRSLVRAAHARGMKVIVDVVTNHVGRLFFYDFDGDGRADPGEEEPGFSTAGPHAALLSWTQAPPRVLRYDDRLQAVATSDEAAAATGLAVQTLDARHFHRRGQTRDYADRRQKLDGDFPTGLRDLDTEQADVVEGLIDSYLRWIELTDVDGFRLDAVPHVPHAFWARFARELRRALAERGKQRFLLLGEVFDRDPELLASYTREGGLDAVFDFPFKWDVIDGFLLDGRPAASVRPALEGHRARYPASGHPQGIGLAPWQVRVALADNHDLQRIRRELDDPFVAELAMTLVFTVDALPSIYYGTEQELSGSWGNGAREVLWEVGFREHTRMFKHIAKLAALRRGSTALRRGELVLRYASPVSARERAPGAGLLAFERVAGAERMLVIANGHPIDRTRAKVPTGFAPGTLLRDRLGASQLLWRVEADGRVPLDVPPRRALLLDPAH